MVATSAAHRFVNGPEEWRPYREPSAGVQVAHLAPLVFVNEPSESRFFRGLEYAMCAVCGACYSKLPEKTRATLRILASHTDRCRDYVERENYDAYNAACDVATAYDALQVAFRANDDAAEARARKAWRKAVIAFATACFMFTVGKRATLFE